MLYNEWTHSKVNVGEFLTFLLLSRDSASSEVASYPRNRFSTSSLTIKKIPPPPQKSHVELCAFWCFITFWKNFSREFSRLSLARVIKSRYHVDEVSTVMESKFEVSLTKSWRLWRLSRRQGLNVSISEIALDFKSLPFLYLLSDDSRNPTSSSEITRWTFFADSFSILPVRRRNTMRSFSETVCIKNFHLFTTSSIHKILLDSFRRHPKKPPSLVQLGS